jgi:hypothetical protein
MKYSFGINVSLSTLPEKNVVKHSLQINDAGREIKPFWLIIYQFQHQPWHKKVRQTSNNL